MGEWQVISNYISGTVYYAAARIINTCEPMHSGNIEIYGGYVEDRREAEKTAQELNDGTISTDEVSE